MLPNPGYWVYPSAEKQRTQKVGVKVSEPRYLGKRQCLPILIFTTAELDAPSRVAKNYIACSHRYSKVKLKSNPNSILRLHTRDPLPGAPRSILLASHHWNPSRAEDRLLSNPSGHNKAHDKPGIRPERSPG